MRIKRQSLIVLSVLVLAVLFDVVSINAQGPEPESASLTLGTAISYNGQLKSGGVAVNGTCDFQFALYDALTLGSRIGATQTVSSLAVANGLFATPIDFGAGAMTGDARFLNIQARCPAGAGAYTALNPRQTLSPAPMALALPGLWTQQNATSPNLIGGYSGNVISTTAIGGTIGGGGANGAINRVTKDYGTIGGGSRNTASGFGATVGGGGFILGNTASNSNATVGGGGDNEASGVSSVVAGGYNNTASFTDTTVSGGFLNSAIAARATVGGGMGNAASGQFSTVGGGYTNTASALYSTVAGGDTNTASGDFASVGGGTGSTANGFAATVGGGNNNHASNRTATVAGGHFNYASGQESAVVGGDENNASGDLSTVLGGNLNTASGTGSMAGGQHALANGDGCFAWGDASTSNVISCEGNNLWSIRSTGGFFFRPSPTALCSLTDASGWQCSNVSDRNAKQDFKDVNAQQVLQQVAALPIQNWTYKDDAAQVQHLGPMAQDFYAAFGLGADDKHINPVDTEGVSLAAIQGLNQVVQEKDARITRLEGDNAALKARVDSLDNRLAALENRTSATVAVAGTLPLNLTPEWLLGGGVLLGLMLSGCAVLGAKLAKNLLYFENEHTCQEAKQRF
jgi:hypothetical protein